MILDATKRFSEVENGTYLAVGGHLVQKISDTEVVTLISHIWEAGKGRQVIRDFAGSIRKHNPKHFVYVGDVRCFLPYIRQRGQ